MNQQEKTQFVNDICDNLRHALLERVSKMPEDWDGIEIREFLADTVSTKFNYRPMERSRKRAYANAVLVNNLD